MANKFVNMTVGGAITPINVEDVVAVSATGQTNAAGAAAIIVMTYKNGTTMTFSTGINVLAFSVAYEPTIEKAWWDVIISALATPWNLPVYPSLDEAWGYTFLPVSQASQYVRQSATPTLNTFEAKQSQELKANNAAAAAVQTDLVIASIAIA
tara:strand:- start:90 stop:548 length:459 start_codon:yes stop_codon:yes gene_type:complete